MTPETEAKVCQTYGCGRTDIVYSGTDAFGIAGGGAPTERFCYTCMRAYTAIRDAIFFEYTSSYSVEHPST